MKIILKYKRVYDPLHYYSLVCSLKFLTPYPKDGHSSLDDLLLRGFKRGIRGLFLGGRALLECGKTQDMCVCSKFSLHPILKFCLRLPKNDIPSGFLV